MTSTRRDFLRGAAATAAVAAVAIGAPQQLAAQPRVVAGETYDWRDFHLAPADHRSLVLDEICRIFRVPAGYLVDIERGGFGMPATRAFVDADGRTWAEVPR
jgi:hypothetical protein